jgi:osmoprotectant transport system permease protein
LPYDAVVLIAPQRADDGALRSVLAPLISAIPLELMQEANYRVDRERDNESPAAAARWLAAEIALSAD